MGTKRRTYFVTAFIGPKLRLEGQIRSYLTPEQFEDWLYGAVDGGQVNAGFMYRVNADDPEAAGIPEATEDEMNVLRDYATKKLRRELRRGVRKTSDEKKPSGSDGTPPAA